jgi:hypothetical protein
VKNSTPFLINRNIPIPAGSVGILPTSTLKWRIPLIRKTIQHKTHPPSIPIQPAF